MKIIDRLHSEVSTVQEPPWHDLSLVLAGAVVLLGLFGQEYLAPPLGLLRITLSVVYVLFVPGYCLVAAIFAPGAQPDRAERIALSIGMSAAIIPLLALMLNQTSWGIRPWPILISLFAVTAAASGIAMVRRARAARAPSVQLASTNRGARTGSGPPAQNRRWLWGVSALIPLLMVGGALHSLYPAPRLTEFYILGRDGLAQDYPRAAAGGALVDIQVGLVSYEADRTTYRIETWARDAWADARPISLATYGPLTLEPGERFETHLSWRMPQDHSDSQIELLLFVEGDTQPYRRLHLWMERDP